MLRSTFLTVSCAFIVAPAHGQNVSDLPGPPELFIERPFANPDALQRFQSYIDRLSQKLGRPVEIPDGFWEAAPYIDRWAYRFEKPSEGSQYELYFSQTYNARPMIDGMLRTVGGLRKGGCSFYRAKNPRITQFSAKRITVVADIDGKKRACGDYPWGGGWATDLADIGGRATASVQFRTEATSIPDGRYNGRFLADDPSVDVDAEAQSVFGINVNSIVGQILSIVIDRGNDVYGLVRDPGRKSATEVLNIFNVDAIRVEDSITLSILHVAGENGAISSKKYNGLMSDLKSARWSTQNSFAMVDEDTGFTKIDEQQSLVLAYKSTLRPSAPVRLVYADAKREIDWLRGFQTGEEIHRVKLGDSLWSIARRKYGDGFFYNLVAGYNGLDRKAQNSLQVGTEIRLPPAFEFDVVQNVHFMLPGQTATSVCRELASSGVAACLRQLRKDNPTMNLSKLKALEHIVISGIRPNVGLEGASTH